VVLGAKDPITESILSSSLSRIPGSFPFFTQRSAPQQHRSNVMSTPPPHPPVLVGAPPATPTSQDATEQMRIRYAFWLAVFGLGVAALLVMFLVWHGWTTASDVVAVVGLFTSVLGTLVGAFFSLQVGAAGREKEQQATREATRVAMRALAALPPEQAGSVIQPPP
jgi:hypothetical protein